MLTQSPRKKVLEEKRVKRNAREQQETTRKTRGPEKRKQAKQCVVSKVGAGSKEPEPASEAVMTKRPASLRQALQDAV